MSFRDRYLESVVGTFLIGTMLVLALSLAFSLWGRGRLHRTHTYTLVLEEGVGLERGVEVTIAGMPVGRVESVRLTPDRRVWLELSVQSSYADHVKADSVGEASMTLSGKVVRIGPGTPEAPALADGGELVSGHNFDVLRALEQMDLVGNLERLEAILTDLNELAAQLRIGDGRIPEAMDAMMELVADLQQGRGTLGKLLKEDATADELLAVIRSMDQMAGKVESAAVAMERSSASIDGAGTAIIDGAGHIAAASEALGSTAKSVDLSASKLAGSLDRLDAGLIELEKTMRAIQRIPFVKGGARKEDRDAEDETPP